MNKGVEKFLTRPLVADDLQRVVEIDSKYSGRRRDGFFRKRLDAALAEPHKFVYLGCEIDAVLQGFLLARLQEGEYGSEEPSASFDAIGVDPGGDERHGPCASGCISQDFAAQRYCSDSYSG